MYVLMILVLLKVFVYRWLGSLALHFKISLTTDGHSLLWQVTTHKPVLGNVIYFYFLNYANGFQVQFKIMP